MLDFLCSVGPPAAACMGRGSLAGAEAPSAGRGPRLNACPAFL
ncbi:hypothetical protein [Ottowia massiliensis]|nr:hypothetical protein [Ottowia massiliensis]